MSDLILCTDISVKLTPMMEQYRSIKKTLPSDTILFFRLGDFYEMFFEDAVKSAEILNITLTGREGGKAGRIPMCGIPYHAFQGYVRTLIENNLKVAICEQVGDVPKGKGLVERKVTRIVSPATYLDDETNSKNHQYMVALKRKGQEATLAYLELSTGDFFVRELTPERVYDELALLSPREVILSKEDAGDEALSLYIKEALGATVTSYEEWIFEPDDSLKLLQETFQLGSPSGISFHEHDLAVGVCGAILYYLKDHFHASIDHIQLPRLFNAEAFMVLDRQAQKSLELVQTLSGSKGQGTLLAVLDETETAMGARTLYDWLTHPLLSLGEIKKRQDALSEFIQKESLRRQLLELLRGVKDVERTMSRLNYGVANARDLVNLKFFLERVPSMQDILGEFNGELIQKACESIKPFSPIKELIERSIVPEPPLAIKDGGIIQKGYHSELDELREISSNGKEWILEFQQKEIQRTGIKNLKIKYSNVFGYTLEVSKSYLNLVPEDYIRRQTLANHERYITPELKVWDEKITGAHDKIKALEYKIFLEVKEKVLEDLASLQEMAKAIGVLDALLSLTQVAISKRWVKPEMTAGSELEIRGGRHPVVESMLPTGRFVENNSLLDGEENQLILLTGPNMAGKSTYIRQVAHIVLLAQMGSFIPAASAKIGLVDRVFTRIGASDDLARGESTFMVEMLETAHILQQATNRSLLILDEVGRGTSTFDGVSIAWAICEYLVQNSIKPRTLFATHYHELTQLEDHFDRIKNYKVKVKESASGITFLRKVVPGSTDRSYGIHVAGLAGMPQAVIERSKTILAILEAESREATEIIESKGESKASNSKHTTQDSLQTTFFNLKVEKSPILEDLEALNLNDLTPLEALNKINEWKKKLNS